MLRKLVGNENSAIFRQLGQLAAIHVPSFFFSTILLGRAAWLEASGHPLFAHKGKKCHTATLQQAQQRLQSLMCTWHLLR